jgi:hypothetical protein
MLMMLTKKLFVISFLSFILTGFALGPSLSAGSNRPDPIAETIVTEVQDIGIVVDKAELDQREKIYRCKYCGELIDVGTIHSHAEDDVRGMLKEALTANNVGYKDGKG